MNEIISLSQEDIQIIKKLQGDMPITQTPYKVIAEELGITEERLFTNIASFQEKGLLKRVGAIVNHQTAGFMANAMVVWNVPLKDIEEIGTLFAQQPFVSHCYQRDALPDFSYTLYTMLHAKSEEECLSNVKILSDMAAISDYEILCSLKELKKSSMQYF